MQSMKKYSIRELSRHTKVVMADLPCLVTHNKKIIAKIEKYDLSDSAELSGLPASTTEEDRGHLSDEAGGGNLSSL